MTLSEQHQHCVKPAFQLRDSVQLRAHLGERRFKLGQPLVTLGKLLANPTSHERSHTIQECFINRKSRRLP